MEAAPKTERLFSLDVLRACAVLLMLQGHVFTALLNEHERTSAWFSPHDFVHGFTAPLFLFSSGLAFGVVQQRLSVQNEKSWLANVMQRFSRSKKRWTRFLWILGIGYLLHFPARPFRDFWGPEHLRLGRIIFNVDVLQHIAISLSLAQLMFVLMGPSPKLFMLFGLSAVTTVLLSPDVWTWTLPLPVAGFFHGNEGALFPLFPWAAYTHLGIFVAMFAGAGQFRWWATCASLLGLGVATVLYQHSADESLQPQYWLMHPSILLFRASCILLFFAVLIFLSPVLLRLPKDWKAWLTLMGSESLVIYVVHLMVLHGNWALKGVLGFWGPTLNSIQATGVTFLLIVSMTLTAKAWRWLQTHGYMRWFQLCAFFFLGWSYFKVIWEQ